MSDACHHEDYVGECPVCHCKLPGIGQHIVLCLGGTKQMFDQYRYEHQDNVEYVHATSLRHLMGREFYKAREDEIVILDLDGSALLELACMRFK